MADDPDTEPRLEAWERRADLPLTVLSVFYLLVFAVQVLATRPGQTWWGLLDATLWALWGVYVVDYVARIGLARRRLRFIVRHPLDLLVVAAPFLRFLRLLRLVAAIATLNRVLRDDFRGRVGSYLIVSVSLLSFVAALAVFEAERDAPDASIVTFGDALWWVLTTITTVGYGDLYPVTTQGRLVAAGLMIAGIAVLGTVTAAIATWFLEQIGARDPAEALPGRAAGAADPPDPPGTDLGAGNPAPSPVAAPSGEVGELLAEIRSLRSRLEQLEDREQAPR
ncbi:potassium channel family protein [Actinomycetospora cinnamomea]|uniref:Voltage-gated potassium channel n=1 Tax=Actinomycetospora cinnamomea TaxID=663609 RepID=A0A2U1EDG3_9PSEU|nr:potassium channel family protein [Actinomycetospora cinnamomea]PVY97739.1 voltage-gated potassium channel [Actinomycetospora cinnamomea]